MNAQQKKGVTTTRVNLILPNSAKEILTYKAEAGGVSVQDVIRTYIQRGLAIDAILEDGGRIFAESNKNESVLIADARGMFMQPLFK